jgi:hypothetical protein
MGSNALAIDHDDTMTTMPAFDVPHKLIAANFVLCPLGMVQGHYCVLCGFSRAKIGNVK